VVPGDVEELFAEPIERVATSDVVEYHPGLLGEARLHYEKSNVSVDHWQSLTLVATVHGTLASDPWQQSIVRSSSVPCTDGPLRDTQFAALPSELASSKSYKSFARDLADHLYRDQRLTLSFAPAFNRAAQIDESELAFKQRLAVELAGERAAAERQLRDTYDKKLAAAQSRVDKAQAYYDEQNSQFWVRVMGMFWKVIDLILAATSGKSTSRRTSSSASAARQAATERGQATRAKQKLDAALAERDDLMAEQQRQLEQLATKYDPATIVVEPLEIVPKKGDIAVQRVALVWLPGRVDERGGWIPLW
jgi:hypothetical protein